MIRVHDETAVERMKIQEAGKTKRIELTLEFFGDLVELVSFFYLMWWINKIFSEIKIEPEN